MSNTETPNDHERPVRLTGQLGIGARVRTKNTASMNGLEGVISFQDGNLFSVSMDNGKEYGFAAWELEAAA